MKCKFGGWIIGLLLFGTMIPQIAAQTQTGYTLPDRQVLERFNLVRKWHTLVPMLSRELVISIKYREGLLFVQTNQGMIHCLDSESGDVRWSVKVAALDREVHPPALSSEFVYLVTGKKLLQIDRNSGRLLWTKEMPSAAISGPAASDTHVFVNSIDRKIYAVSLEDEFGRKFSKRPIDWFYDSGGTLDNAPVLIDQFVFFATREGTMYASTQAERRLSFRFFAYSSITAPIAHLDEKVFVSTGDFNLFALDYRNGALIWRFRTGYPIRQRPIALAKDIYFVPEGMGLYCLNTETGKEKWLNTEVSQLLAASRKNVYASDAFGNFLAISREDGHTHGTLAMPRFNVVAHNQATDRIFLSSTNGLIICMHEPEFDEPYVHAEVADEEATTQDDAPAMQDQPKRNFFGEIVEESKGDDKADKDAPAEEKEEKKTIKNFFDF